MVARYLLIESNQRSFPNTEFQSTENGTTTAGLYGIVTAQPVGVPEPTTLLLLVSGLGGVTVLRRARKI